MNRVPDHPQYQKLNVMSRKSSTNTLLVMIPANNPGLGNRGNGRAGVLGLYP
jgi:hypothetical protein